jgi:hypothetical protein
MPPATPVRRAGCAFKEVAVRADGKQGEWSDARQPHEVRAAWRAWRLVRGRVSLRALFAYTHANLFVHRSIRHLFQRCLTQYDKLMRRKAFLDNYEQHAMFKARRRGPAAGGECPSVAPG